MALPNRKGPTQKAKRDTSGKRYLASIWNNESKTGGDDYLSLSVDNLEVDSEYNKGSLLWWDKETGKYYKVKSMAVYPADKGPKNLTNKIVLDINNEYHVEEVDQ